MKSAEDEDLKSFPGFRNAKSEEAKGAADREKDFRGDGGRRNFGEVADGPQDIQNEPGGVGASHKNEDAFFFDEAKHDERGQERDSGEEVGQELPFKKPEAVEKKPEENAEDFQNGVGLLRASC